jgi:hypothetical protein
MPPGVAKRGLRALGTLEILVSVALVIALAAAAIPAIRELRTSASLATSASVVRQLSAGGLAYLGDHNGQFWPYRAPGSNGGVRWWFGEESAASLSSGEGNRDFDPSEGPLGGYVAKGFRPDPSFALEGNAFKPKYRRGYLGIGYNTLLGGGFSGTGIPRRAAVLASPGRVVVFFTSAQVNTFQRPASSTRPMLEEFYGIDARETTVHFRHRGKALVAFADGTIDFLEIDGTTRDSRLPAANVGRFAPKGNTLYLE